MSEWVGGWVGDKGREGEKEGGSELSSFSQGYHLAAKLI